MRQRIKKNIKMKKKEGRKVEKGKTKRKGYSIFVQFYFCFGITPSGAQGLIPALC